jgi:hypothetical protein
MESDKNQDLFFGASEAGVGEADLGRALAQLSGSNSSLAQLSHAPDVSCLLFDLKKSDSFIRLFPAVHQCTETGK